MGFGHHSEVQRRMGMGWPERMGLNNSFRQAPTLDRIFKKNEEALATDPDLTPFLQSLGVRMRKDPNFLLRMESDLQRHPERAERLQEIIAHGSKREQYMLYSYVNNGYLPPARPLQEETSVPVVPAAAPEREPEPTAEPSEAAVSFPVTAPAPDVTSPAPEPERPALAPQAPAASPAENQPSPEAMRMAAYLAENPGATVRMNNADGRKLQESQFFFQHQNEEEKQASIREVAGRLDEMMGETVKEKAQLNVRDAKGNVAFTSNGRDLQETAPPDDLSAGVRTFTAGGAWGHSSNTLAGFTTPTLGVEAEAPLSINMSALSFGDSDGLGTTPEQKATGPAPRRPTSPQAGM